MTKRIKMYVITGTFHGSHVYARSEGDARRAFHSYYNGESIIHMKVVVDLDMLRYD